MPESEFPKLNKLDSKWPEWLLQTNGKLPPFWVNFYAKMLKIPAAHLTNIIILSGARKKNIAETWGKNRIKINTQTDRTASDIAWVGTIAHELIHEYDYFNSPLPAFLLRFQQNIIKYFKQYLLGYSHEKAYISSVWEVRAFSNQQKVMQLICHSNYEVLTNPAISDNDKEAILMKLISEFKNF
jgi:hypothetical protein